MTKVLLKRILAIIYLLIITFIVVLIFLNKDLLFNLDIEKFQSEYEKLKIYVNDNKFLSIGLYLLMSIIWICFVGIVSPLLFISSLLFGYFGIILSIFSFTLGSVLTLIIANIFKNYLKKDLINFSKIKNFKENSIFLFTIFRLIPGMPFILKNILAIFFNLTYKQFILATIIAELPQVILYTYVFKKTIDTAKILTSELRLEDLTSELLIPSSILLIFFILLFILKSRYSKYFK